MSDQSCSWPAPWCWGQQPGLRCSICSGNTPTHSPPCTHLPPGRSSSLEQTQTITLNNYCWLQEPQAICWKWMWSIAGNKRCKQTPTLRNCWKWMLWSFGDGYCWLFKHRHSESKVGARHNESTVEARHSESKVGARHSESKIASSQIYWLLFCLCRCGFSYVLRKTDDFFSLLRYCHS